MRLMSFDYLTYIQKNIHSEYTDVYKTKFRPNRSRNANNSDMGIVVNLTFCNPKTRHIDFDRFWVLNSP